MSSRTPLAGHVLPLVGSGPAHAYAAAMLEILGAEVQYRPGPSDPSAHLEWARSGAMALTGETEGPPRLVRGPLASCARGLVLAFAALTRDPRIGALDGAALLGERAAIFGYGRRGSTAPGGSCRLVRARDHWIAVNLARPEDCSLLPAWLEDPECPNDMTSHDLWASVTRKVRVRNAADLIARGRLLGLPVACAPDGLKLSPRPWRDLPIGEPVDRSNRARPPRVVDLSALWAGPLCTHLFQQAGACVIKVESVVRPDGARRGPASFFNLLNAGKSSVALDFREARDLDRLRWLIRNADIVVESSRPRALAQIGIDAEAQVTRTPGLTWISITGYGRQEPQANWVAFGDDAGVAAGLSRPEETGGGPPVFCADALADPLTGLHAAVSGLASWRGGGGRLLDLSLQGSSAAALCFRSQTEAAQVQHRGDGWEVICAGGRARVAPPRARPPGGRAHALGEDTDSCLHEWESEC